jgi:hypothetical protein
MGFLPDNGTSNDKQTKNLHRFSFILKYLANYRYIIKYLAKYRSIIKYLAKYISIIKYLAKYQHQPPLTKHTMTYDTGNSGHCMGQA